MIQVCPDICRYTGIHTRDTLTQKQSNTSQNIVKCVTCTWTQEQITGKKWRFQWTLHIQGDPPNTWLDVHDHLPTLPLLALAVGLSSITAWAGEMVPPALLPECFCLLSWVLLLPKQPQFFSQQGPHDFHFGKVSFSPKKNPFYSKDNYISSTFLSTLHSFILNNLFNILKYLLHVSTPCQADTWTWASRTFADEIDVEH